MAADVISPKFTLSTSLDTELENARATLRGVETRIKRVFGKDASELNTFQQHQQQRGPHRRSLQSDGQPVQDIPSFDQDVEERQRTTFRGRERDAMLRRRDSDNYGERDEEPVDKRRRFDNFSVTVKRSTPIVLSSKLIKPDPEEGEYENGNEYYNNGGGGGGGGRRSRDRDQGRGDIHQRLQSRVVSSAKEKSREEVLAEQRQDHSGRDRNRRMFGALLGTLHRFKQDETKLKEKEEKRAQIEAKLEEQAMQEKESVKKEKQQLIRDRRVKLTEIKRLEFKKNRLEELEEWESKAGHLRNFIRTETKPHIFYLPKQMNPITECRLEESKQIVEEMIVNKRKLVLSELENYEEQSRRYWEHNLDGQDSGRPTVDALDANMEDELKALMKDDIFGNDDLRNVVSVLIENKERKPKTPSTAAGEESLQNPTKEMDDEEFDGDEQDVNETSVSSGLKKDDSSPVERERIPSGDEDETHEEMKS